MNCFFKRQWLSMSEIEALLTPMALMRNTPAVYDAEEIISWT